MKRQGRGRIRAKAVFCSSTPLPAAQRQDRRSRPGVAFESGIPSPFGIDPVMGAPFLYFCPYCRCRFPRSGLRLVSLVASGFHVSEEARRRTALQMGSDG